MTFQTEVVNSELAYGVVGEIAFTGPVRSKVFTLNSGTEDNNVIGRAFTVSSQGVAVAGGDGGVFAGILVNPKSYAFEGLFNNDSGELSCRNGTPVELLIMGEIWVKFATTANIGDLVKYTDTTGVLAPGSAGSGETQVPNAVVSQFSVAEAGLALIKLTN